MDAAFPPSHLSFAAGSRSTHRWLLIKEVQIVILFLRKEVFNLKCHTLVTSSTFTSVFPSPIPALGYFLGDTKAVLNGCEDHWTLPDRSAMPLLFQMTVCVDIRVVRPGAWVAFSYSSVYAPKPELGLEGDDGALYGWLLRVRHRFPLRLSPTVWHRVCLRRDVRRNSFSLEVIPAVY